MLKSSLKNCQSGVMLLEAMVAILIFSIGVLGIVGMQAAAIGASRDAHYRTDAGLLTTELIGRMWASDRRGSALQTAFSGAGATGGTEYLSWKTDVAAVLPGADVFPPLVAVTQGAVTPGPNPGTNILAPHSVAITIRWKAPGDATNHQYVVNTLITQAE